MYLLDTYMSSYGWFVCGVLGWHCTKASNSRATRASFSEYLLLYQEHTSQGTYTYKFHNSERQKFTLAQRQGKMMTHLDHSFLRFSLKQMTFSTPTATICTQDLIKIQQGSRELAILEPRHVRLGNLESTGISASWIMKANFHIKSW